MRSEQEALTAVMETLGEHFAYETGAPLMGFTCNKVDGGWLLIVRTKSVQRGRLVAFFGGATLADCWEHLWQVVNTNPGINWKPDKFLNGK